MIISVLLTVSYIATLAVSIGIAQALGQSEYVGFVIGSMSYLIFLYAKYDVKSMLSKKNTCQMRKLKLAWIYYICTTIVIFSIVILIIILMNRLGMSWKEIGKVFIRDRDYNGVELMYFVVLAPIVEEILFRGIIFERLLLKNKTLYANIIQASLFAVVHGTPVKWINTFILGIFFGQVKVKSGTIRNTIFMHMFWNAFSNAFFISVKCILS